MSRTAKKENTLNSTDLILALFVLLTLIISAFNISVYLNRRKVLGISTSKTSKTVVNKDEQFWTNFLTTNPNYLPGWVELDKYDKAKEIDPNYLTP